MTYDPEVVGSDSWSCTKILFRSKMYVLETKKNSEFFVEFILMNLIDLYTKERAYTKYSCHTDSRGW